MSRLSPALLVAAAATAGTASAQYEYQHLVPLTDDLAGHGPLGSSASGEFTGDLRRDVVQVAGDRAWILASPCSYQSVIALDPGNTIEVTDVAVLPDATQYGLDLILSVGSDGLSSWELDAATNTFARTLIEGSAWANAISVDCVDLDADGDLDVLGLASNGTTVLRYKNTAGSLSTIPSMTLPAVATSIAAVRWTSGLDGSGVDWAEISAMSSSWLRIVAVGNSVLDSFASQGPSVRQCVYSAAGQQRVLWIHKTADLSQDYVRALRPGSASEPGFAIGAFGTSGLAMGDADFDGDDDAILVGNTSTNFLLLVDNPAAAGSNSFGMGSGQHAYVPLFQPGGGSSAQAAQPLIADFDGDLDLDVYVGAEGMSAALVHRSPLASEGQQKILVESLGFESDGTMHVDIVWPAIVSFDPNFEPTHVEGALFQVDASGLVTGDPWQTFDVVIGSPFATPTSLSFELGDLPCALCADPANQLKCDVRLVLRIVERDGGSNVRAGVDSATYYLSPTSAGPGGTTGSNPLPQVGPTPPGQLPPRPPGSVPA